MLNGEAITAIVPARGGSKGLPGKNMLELLGEPLTRRAAGLALASPHADRVIVSSDAQDILACVRDLDGVEAIERPAALSRDETRTLDVVVHLIETADIERGWILLLQPTSPLRTLHDLDEVIALARDHRSAVVSVVAHDEPRPEKLQTLTDGKIRPYLDQAYEGPRQALPMPYALNGAFYLIHRDMLLKERTFLPGDAVAYVMPAERSVNIDSPQDWQVLNAMIAAGHWQAERY